jgi:hypothetical protein
VKPNTCFENSAPPLFPLPDWARRLRGGRKLPKASLNPSGGENASRLSKRLWGAAAGCNPVGFGRSGGPGCTWW